MPEWILSVTQLNEYVRRALAADPMLRGVRLRGEISNGKRYPSGHFYFSLKDEQSRIQCVMFRTAVETLAFTPENGMRVVALGNAALYTRDGQYQFYVDQLKADGVGAMFAQFEKLKAKLQAEGLFDASRKRALPALPRGVGVVTSLAGAVIHDICRVARARFAAVPIYLLPVRVQGPEAAREIADAIGAFGGFPHVDVLIVGRGGGSLEDLWAFNEEIVARAIARSRLPVVSAVGHETDFTIADFTADVRAATPSNAAELVFPERDGLSLTVDALYARMMRALDVRHAGAVQRLALLNARLRSVHPLQRMQQQRMRLAALHARLLPPVSHKLRVHREALRLAATRMAAIHPERVLARGYAYITDGAGAPVAHVSALSPHMAVRLMLQDGHAAAQILSVAYKAAENSGGSMD